LLERAQPFGQLDPVVLMKGRRRPQLGHDAEADARVERGREPLTLRRLKRSVHREHEHIALEGNRHHPELAGELGRDAGDQLRIDAFELCARGGRQIEARCAIGGEHVFGHSRQFEQGGVDLAAVQHLAL
jgi:hypothetical protein